MNTSLINLLPHTSITGYRREYLYRLLTVACVAATLVLIANAILLFPTYLYVRETVSKEQASLALLEKISSTSDEQKVAARIQKLGESSRYLERLETTPKMATFVSGLLAVPHTGVQINSISITPPAAATQTTKSVVSGVARSREDLRAYTIALGAVPTITSVDLPIGVYAQESQIPFSITVMGTFAP